MERQDMRNLLVRIAGTFFLVLAGSATSAPLVNHTFTFDARRDSPDVEILDYRYGDSKIPAARADPTSVLEGRVRQQVGITGEMLWPEFVYLKWRIRSSGAVYEETVDLRNRLPSDITNHRITLIVWGPQLYVFLIAPERVSPSPCPSRETRKKLQASEVPGDKIFAMFCGRKTTTIYPTQIQK